MKNQYRLSPYKEGYTLERGTSVFFGLFTHWWPVEYFSQLEYAERKIKEYQKHEKEPVRYY